MSGHRGGKRRGGGHESEHPDERWLVSYADMVTLLMALFIVLFAIANVNTDKFQELKVSLANAFSGPVKEGGGGILPGGATDAAVQGAILQQVAAQEKASDSESEDLQELKERVDSYAKEKGLSSKLSARIERRGLVITILTDDLLFDSGSASLKGAGTPLVHAVGELLRKENRHQIVVEGHTDNVPISGQFPSNWELSTARAATVVRELMDANVTPRRLTASGRADLDPLETNTTEDGRSTNRRVQIILPRQVNPPTGSNSADPDVGPAQPQIGPSEPDIGPEDSP